MEEKIVKEEQALENRCPSCTASIKYNPKVKKFKCEYCGSEFTLEELKKFNDNASTDAKNKPVEQQPVDNYDGYISYKCESCGAEIIADEQTASTFCVYCGNTAILKSKLSGKFTPSRIIPFKQAKENAITAFKGLSKGRPLMPKDFNSEKNIEKIKGVYIPFWLYDLEINGDINLRATNVKHWVVGDTHYTKTDVYNLIRGGKATYRNIPVDGSSRFDNDVMNTLEPFQYEELIPYNHAYLSGFYAEKYDVEGEEPFREVSERANNSAKDYFSGYQTRQYTTHSITSSSLTSNELKKEYVLLPVWMVNVKFQNKMHLFAMNGQTGEFIGNIPIDGKRVFKYSVMIFTITAVIGTIVSYILFLMGEA